MENSKNATIFASDKRFYSVAVLLSKDGYKCNIVTPEGTKFCDAIKESDIIILPIPSFDENDMLLGCIHADKLFSCLKSGTRIFAGKVLPIITRLAKEYNIRLYDYSARDEFSIMNAVPTAEGAIITYIKAVHSTLASGKFVILGYGKVGKALAPRLRALGGKVTVAARNVTALSQAEADGCDVIDFQSFLEDPPTSSAVFNTVPSPVINDMTAYKIKDQLFIDLASRPGGATENAKKILASRYIHALSLPGKYFPDTAGEIIYKTISGILGEEEKNK